MRRGPKGERYDPRFPAADRFARERFVVAVRKEARGAYGQVQDFAKQLLKRLGPELDREREAQESLWKDRPKAMEPSLEDLGPELWQVTFHLPYEHSPDASQEWSRFASQWNQRWNLVDEWVAEWILYRVVVGRRNPTDKESKNRGYHRRTDFFAAMVPKTLVESIRLGPLIPARVLPDWYVTEERRRDYKKRAEDALRDYIDDVDREAERRDLPCVPRPTVLTRDLVRLACLQFAGTRPDEMSVGRETYSDTWNALNSVARLIGLTMPQVEPKPASEPPPRRT